MGIWTGKNVQPRSRKQLVGAITLIRLLQIAKHFSPDTGGIETVTESVSNMLLSHGIRADVLCTGSGGTYTPLDRAYAVHRCRPNIRFGRNKSLSAEYMRAIGRMSAEYDIGLLHMPNPVGALAVLLGWKKPLILLWHADIPQATIRWLATPLDAAVVRQAMAIIGPTVAHLQQSHRAALIGAKGNIIPLPFERRRLPLATGSSAAAQRVRAFASGRKVALSVGRLVPYKGFDVLIDAVHNFSANLVSVIVGGGPLRDGLLEHIARAGLQQRVMLTGPLDDASLADLLDMADMLCMPSVTAAEMYGMVQLEAFAFGKPVVSTRIPRSGVPYVNRDGETGLVVAPNDSKALAAALSRLATDDGLRASLGEGALRSIEKDHDLERISHLYAELIRQTVIQYPRS